MSKIKNTEPRQQEKRKGFHPALVIATIAVVIFVLWFCPYYLMQARTEQTEAAAVSILNDESFTQQEADPAREGVVRLTPEKKYADYVFFKTTSSPALTYAIPEYYGDTARLTFILSNGKIYQKDIADISPEAKLPKLDHTWQTL